MEIAVFIAEAHRDDLAAMLPTPRIDMGILQEVIAHLTLVAGKHHRRHTHMLKHIPDENEVRGDGDGVDSQGRQLAAESQPEEEVKQHDMQAVVHQMGTSEAHGVLARGTLLEGEMSRHPVVHQETENISHGVGYIHVDPMLQYPVDGVVDGRGDDPRNAKP